MDSIRLGQRVVVFLFGAFGSGHLIGIDKIEQRIGERSLHSGQAADHRGGGRVEVQLGCLVGQSEANAAFGVRGVESPTPLIGTVVVQHAILESLWGIHPGRVSGLKCWSQTHGLTNPAHRARPTLFGG